MASLVGRKHLPGSPTHIHMPYSRLSFCREKKVIYYFKLKIIEVIKSPRIARRGEHLLGFVLLLESTPDVASFPYLFSIKNGKWIPSLRSGTREPQLKSPSVSAVSQCTRSTQQPLCARSVRNLWKISVIVIKMQSIRG